MTNLERARQYVGLFIGAGDRWRGCVPLDATAGEGDVIYLHDIQMQRIDADTWELTEDATTYVVRRAPVKEAAS